ncbi:MAG: GNAT family N-acetyltransferase, partial [Acidimicrobiia bacterium]
LPKATWPAPLSRSVTPWQGHQPRGGMEIRRIRREEWAQFRSLRLSALSDAPYAFASSFAEEERQPDEQWQEWAQASIFIASHQGEWIGMAGAHRDEDPGIVVVWGMWVDPRRRRSGLGRRLLGAVIDWARAQGARRLRLGVTDSNEPAVSFYLANGFVPTGQREPLRSNPSLMEIEMERDVVP